jgi:hypothetical protein
MAKTEYITVPEGRSFVLFSMGLDGHNGDCELWDVPNDEVSVYHILVRIAHEMALLKTRTGEDFYLFGTGKNFVNPRDKIIENYGTVSIDILFTVNQKDEENTLQVFG